MAWLADTATSTHQSLPTAFGVKDAAKAGAVADVLELPSHGCGAEAAVWPAPSVARKETGVPFSTCTLAAQLPQDLRAIACQGPPLALSSTFAGAADEATLTSSHHSLEPEATVNEAVNVGAEP